MGEDASRGLAFATMVIGQLILVLIERADKRPLWRVGLHGNRVVVPILVGAAMALVLVEVFPPIAGLLHMVSPSPEGWLVAIAVAAATTMWGELGKLRRA
jgi:magnesium-transporting ATPase (P-type)